MSDATSSDTHLEWSSRATELGYWAFERLVNRRDVWLRYDRSGMAYAQAQGQQGRPRIETVSADAHRGIGQLTPEFIAAHFAASETDNLLAVHTTSVEQTCKWCAIDLDCHTADPERADTNQRVAIALYAHLVSKGVQPLLIDSDGLGSFHLFILFAKPVQVEVAYDIANRLSERACELGSDLPEAFPKQKALEKNGVGNAVRLPGRHHTQHHWAKVWSGDRWLSGGEAAQALLESQPAVARDIVRALGTELVQRTSETGWASATKCVSEARAKAKPNLSLIAGGCPWLRHCRDDAAYLGEQEWYAMMGIVGLTDEGEPAVHAWSEPYPRYDRNETQRKLEHALASAGPRTCSNIEALTQGRFCRECAHRGNVKSPIVLGLPTAPRPDLSDLLGKLEAKTLLPSGLFDHLESLAAVSEVELSKFFSQLRQLGFAKYVNLTDLKRAVKIHQSSGEQKNQNTYRETDEGLVRIVRFGDMETLVLLTNFNARISADVLHDDGAEQRREFEIEAQVRGERSTFRIPADEFAAMKWPITMIGAHAIIQPGRDAHDHARTAIQALSADIRRKTIYGHSGWRQIKGKHVYLHAGGAIGANGAVDDIEVVLPGVLDKLKLPADATKENIKSDVRSTLQLLDLMPPGIAVPCLGAVFRACLGQCDFSLFLVGKTGAGKTELAALTQQFFGAGFDARHLPGSFISTANATEGTAHATKDCIFVIDDFKPGGSTHDQSRQHAQADRLFRGQANNAGRQRMRPDGSLRPTKASRALMLATGEDVPRGHSLRARLAILDVRREELNWTLLSRCQEHARSGIYARVTAGFVKWLAKWYGWTHQHLSYEVAHFRDHFAGVGQHLRTPTLVADLLVGLSYFLSFAIDQDAVSLHEAAELWCRFQTGLREMAGAQAAHLEDADTARRFLALLRAAISSGRAHLCAKSGRKPRDARALGWSDRGGHMIPQGEPIGWVDGDDLYLNSETCLKVANNAAADGEGLGVSSSTLNKRLDEAGLLVTKDKNRATLTIRRTFLRRVHNVLHLSTRSLGLESAELPVHVHLGAPNAA